jgi:hypothetical protein
MLFPKLGFELFGAWFTALGNIFQAFVIEKLLFADGPNKFVAALFAVKDLIGKLFFFICHYLNRIANRFYCQLR